MQVRVLGRAVEVHGDNGEPVPLQPLMGAALGLLVVADGNGRRGVSRDRLKAMLWGEDDSIDWSGSLKATMSKLRRVLGKDRVVFSGDAYRFVPDEQADYVDLLVLRALVDKANQVRADDDLETAVRLYAHVLEHWSETPLAGIPQTSGALGHIRTLRDERQVIVEAMLEIQLDLGRHREVAASTPALIAADPLNEHLRALRMRALARSGRKAEALRDYDDAEAVAEAETGTKPGLNLQRLRDQVKDNDPVVFAWEAPRMRESDAMVLASGADGSSHSLARMMNYMIGGNFHLPVDRALAEVVLAAAPEARILPIETGDFCRRAVRVAAKAGIDQFIEIGTGLPTKEPIHQIARRVAPGARVLYVSNEPTVVAYLQAQGLNGESANIIHADIWEPKAILEAAQPQIDFTRPVGILIREVLNFVDVDDDPWQIISTLVDAVAPGSRLMLSVATSEGLTEVVQQQISAQGLYEPLPKRLKMWPREAIEEMFVGLPVVEPGLVDANQWWPDRAGRAPIGPMRALVGMAIKP
ncbi:SAM-dependent methyltransferase [Actinomadura rudentiformis]|uniref:Bacterial transcriptional activator domain-containing protein n=1 Tax=Actinomadura rudentiformis TaxID=359158 RepID=A0A6H9YFL6_9ACTN|nr:SAM-dependent methyltransferase [Actinomadura rudentiformis]KAB2344820.1 hypothetical protein F8566_29970 [Actinomadura rudentiformis]